MDGVTDHAYRELWTAPHQRSRVAFCVSEFVRVSDRPLPEQVIRSICPEVDSAGHTPAGVPVMLQLLGGSAAPMAETARTAVRIGAFGIDLNFGCPAKLVNRHDGGASLLRTPERIETIVSEVRRAVPRDRPVSVKIRLGWECHDEVVPIAKAAERGGASWLTIHGRTKCEMYGPKADWVAIGWARAAVGIPVIANGDLNSHAAFDTCQSVSGCAHFMVGRGPMGRPSVLCDTRDADGSELGALRELLLEYLELLARHGHSEVRQVGRVKQWLSLAKRVDPALSFAFESIKQITSRAELRQKLARA